MGTSDARDVMDVLDLCANLVEQNGDALSRTTARLVVLCKFAEAVLPQLTDTQCRQIEPGFRQGVEDAMARVDDVEMPGSYGATLLDQTNILLTALERRQR